MSRPTRIAVFASSFASVSGPEYDVKVFKWDSLAEQINLSDFDSLIVSTIDLDQGAEIHWETFFGSLNPNVVSDLLRHGGSIVVLGDTNFMVNYYLNGSRLVASFLEWTAINFNWDTRKGVTIEIPEDTIAQYPQFRRYVSCIAEYSLSLRSASEHDNERLIKSYWHAQSRWSAHPVITPLAMNRYGNSIAFTIHIELQQALTNDSAAHIVDTLGPIVFLPATSMSEEDALTVVLEDLFEVVLDSQEPNWILATSAPSQGEIDNEIAQIESNSLALRVRRDTLLEERKNVRKPLGLVYAMGQNLEVEVRRAMHALGAEVTEPTEPNKEDGWVAVVDEKTKRLGVLEVKGTRKSTFNEAGLRQLVDWRQRGIENDQTRYKGIFIGNHSIEFSLEERKNPFGEGFVKNLELNEFVALKSSDLYKAYELFMQQKLNAPLFWKILFDTNGIFVFDPHRFGLEDTN